MNVYRVDIDTWNVESESEPGKIYMVYRSIHEGFICECMWWSVHCKNKPPHPTCKHIRYIQKKFINKKL